MPLVEYLFQEVASLIHLHCMHPQLVYSHISLVSRPSSFGFEQFIPALRPLPSVHLDLEFVHELIKEYQLLHAPLGLPLYP